MSRKGRLTTKGKHALILALTIAACVTAMLFSLLLSVLCDGKYVSSAAHAGDISHPALITGKQRQDTDLLTPQWLYYQSDGSVTDRNIKKEMDVLMRKWTKGKLGGKELDRLIKDFYKRRTVRSGKLLCRRKRCVYFRRKGTSGLYKNTCKREKIYQFIGVYTGGQQDENGRLLCEYWEVAIG